MAHIVNFRVEGLAGRSEPYERQLDRRLNIFFGRNGGGKTSLLRILASAMSGNGQTLLDVPFTSATVGLYSDVKEIGFTRTIKKSDIPSENDNAYVAYLGRAPEKKSVVGWKESENAPVTGNGRWAHRFLPVSRIYAPLRPAQYSFVATGSSPEITDGELNEQFAAGVRQLWREYQAGVLNEVQRAQANGLESILQRVLTDKAPTSDQPLDKQQAYERVREFLLRQGSRKVLPTRADFATRLSRNAQFRRIVADIYQVEETIAAARKSTAALQLLLEKLFTGKRVRLDHDEIVVELEGERKVELGALSSGEKQLMKILIEALRVEFNTLLIDEPELSMHVDWQNVLVGTMQQLNPQAQLVLATHSPEIMAEVGDEHIHEL